MRVVITGGTGLIGHALAMSLGHDGHEVIILSRNPRQAGPMPETIQFMAWDGKTSAGWGEAIEAADAVVNLAGSSIAGEGFLPDRWTPERKKLILKSRLDVGQAVMEAIEKATTRPKVLVQASGVGYYGTHKMDVELTEDSPAGNDFLADVCVQWEASTQAAEAMGVRRVVIRTGVVLSDKGGALPRQIMPFKLFAGGPIGSGKQPYPWIHLDDEVAAIRFLIEHPQAAGPFNLTAPHIVTNAEFSRITGKVMNRPAFVPAPGPAFSIAFGEVAVLLLAGQNAVSKKLQEAGYVFKFPDAEAAMQDLYGAEKALAAS